MEIFSRFSYQIHSFPNRPLPQPRRPNEHRLISNIFPTQQFVPRSLSLSPFLSFSLTHGLAMELDGVMEILRIVGKFVLFWLCCVIHPFTSCLSYRRRRLIRRKQQPNFTTKSN